MKRRKQLRKLERRVADLELALRHANEGHVRLRELLHRLDEQHGHTQRRVSGVWPMLADMLNGNRGSLTESIVVDEVDVDGLGFGASRWATPGRKEHIVRYESPDGREFVNGELVAWEGRP